jgi:hypothetical protein
MSRSAPSMTWRAVLVARMECSEIREVARVDAARIARSLSSGAHSRDPLAPSGLRDYALEHFPFR